MLYSILRPLANIFFRVFYSFDYKGLNKIPSKKPIVWAPNHCNAFIDPVMVAMTAPRKVRFFARGDVFKGRFVKWALNSMNMSPMFRMQEGYGEIKKNDKIFEECRTLLSQNKTMLMFPEAICVQERRIRPLKKGLSRIIFQTEELFDFKKDVCVIPVGLNYSRPTQFRSNLFMKIGDPISIKTYEEQYKQDKARTINAFTKKLEEEMAKLVVIIKNPDNDKLVAEIEEIYLHQWLKEKHKNEKSLENQYYGSKEIAEMINFLDEHHPKTIESLKQETKQYTRSLKENKLRDHLLRPDTINKMNLGSFILDFFIIWLGFPLYAIGLATNFPPYFFAKKITTQKVKDVEFFASVYAFMAMIFWLIYYPIQLLCIALLFRSWPLLGIYAILVPLTGIFALWFYPRMKKIFGRLRLLRMVRKERKTVEKLVNERDVIIKKLDLAKKEYFANYS